MDHHAQALRVGAPTLPRLLKKLPRHRRKLERFTCRYTDMCVSLRPPSMSGISTSSISRMAGGAGIFGACEFPRRDVASNSLKIPVGDNRYGDYSDRRRRNAVFGPNDVYAELHVAIRYAEHGPTPSRSRRRRRH